MDNTQDLIRLKGEEIFRQMEDEQTSIFNKDWWYGRIMEWSMKNPHFKVQMFRFVDVLPYLNSGSEVARHLKEYFAEGGDDLPSVFSFGAGLGALAPGLLAGTVRKNVTQMAKMFIVGETPEEALDPIKKARAKKIAFTVDILGEATLSEKEALDYQNRYMELIRWLAKESPKWEEVAQIDRDHTGQIPKVNVSVKVSALYSQINLKSWDKTKGILKERLRPIFQLAKEYGVFINLDMEQYDYKDLTFELYRELLMEPAFRDYPHWGVVLQAYLRDSLSDAKMLVAFAKERGVPFTVRLVKGAYWDYETVKAEQKGWKIPVYTNKKESDANFEDCARVFLEGHQHIRLAVASHNVRSLAATMIMAQKLGLPKEAIEVQMLYGMADPIKRAMVKMGYRVRQYSPVGELIPGMAYLVRRLLENTSNESFLRSKFADNVSTEKLLADPKVDLKPTSEISGKGITGFKNEPMLDFALSKERNQLLAAMKSVRQELGKTFLPVIKNKPVKAERTLASVNPANPKEVVGTFGLATVNDAETAVQLAKETFKTWRKVSAEERAKYLDRIADLMVQRRYELTAIQVLEVGKTWPEADGDVTEAIDFCRYYAADMRRLANPIRVGKGIPGETGFYHYQPRGVAVVIAPWNFPLAILTGMVAAAMVTGNTVIMKPAEQSTVVAAGLMDLIIEAGVPAGVVSFLPGIGEEVGAHLVAHKDVDLIAFTGSKSVGLKIIETAGKTLPGQKHVKRCIVEMGGKNAIIVDSDADLDEAISAVLYSAFGFQGQKCSAASRLIVLDEIHDRFVDRLVEAAKSLKIGPSEDPDNYFGAVIDDEAHARLLGVIEKGKSVAKLAWQGEVPSDGYFVPPTIFTEVDANSFLGQDEFFGPIVAVIRARDIEHALEIANGTEYALTGGLFSRSPANIEKVRFNFECGNFYINRQITGAMVERHPFGGYKMSGVGSKTGGPDYLLQYLEPRVVTENTLRRGFAPTEES